MKKQSNYTQQKDIRNLTIAFIWRNLKRERLKITSHINGNEFQIRSFRANPAGMFIIRVDFQYHSFLLFVNVMLNREKLIKCWLTKKKNRTKCSFICLLTVVLLSGRCVYYCCCHRQTTTYIYDAWNTGCANEWIQQNEQTSQMK